MADAIKSRCGIEAELIEGAGGVFDVRANGDLIYSKHQTGTFPEHNLITEKLSSLLTK